jgi:hypothetical protein
MSKPPVPKFGSFKPKPAANPSEQLPGSPHRHATGVDREIVSIDGDGRTQSMIGIVFVEKLSVMRNPPGAADVHPALR